MLAIGDIKTKKNEKLSQADLMQLNFINLVIKVQIAGLV